MTTTAAPPRSAPALVRWTLAALLLAGALGSAADVRVSTDLGTAVAQAQRGEVSLLQEQNGSRPAGLHLSIGPQDDSRRLVWTGRYGLRHEAFLPSSSSSSDESADAVATVRAAAPPGARPVVAASGTTARERLASVGDVALLVLLLLLVVGPQPRRLTKWGWTWLVLLLPLGAGGGLLLAREAPWSRRTTAEREPVDRHDSAPGVRTTGGTALFVAIVVSIPLSLLAAVGTDLLPGERYERPVTPYDVVRTDGTRAPGTLF